MANSTQKEDLRVIRTRKLIEDAFLVLLGESNLQAITVGKIAKRAMINRGTFYDHFTDKYALFDHIIRKTFLETLVRHDLQACTFSGENVHRLIEATADYFLYLNAQCPPAERHFRPIAEGQVQMVLYEIFCDWLAGHPSRQVTASYLSWAIFGACLQQIGNGESADTDPVTTRIDELTQTILQSYNLVVRQTLLPDSK